MKSTSSNRLNLSPQYIGVDLHTDNFYCCYYQNGKKKKTLKFDLSKEGLKQFISTVTKHDYVSVEATANVSFFRDQIIPYIREIKIVSPADFVIISRSTNKSDLSDAEKLAFYLYKDMLPEARIKSLISRQLLSLISTRKILVTYRMVLNNKTCSILIRHGIKLKSARLVWKTGYEKYVFCHDWDTTVEIELRFIQEEVLHLNIRIEEITEEIFALACTLKGYKNILSVAGVGELSGAILLCIIDDINDFATPSKLCSYFGITPKIKQSNARTKRGGISKKGSKIGRRTLIMCTWQAIRYNSDLMNYYNHVKDRSCSKTAVIATARKLVNIIFKILKEDLIITDFERLKYANHKAI